MRLRLHGRGNRHPAPHHGRHRRLHLHRNRDRHQHQHRHQPRGLSQCIATALCHNRASQSDQPPRQTRQRAIARDLKFSFDNYLHALWHRPAIRRRQSRLANQQCQLDSPRNHAASRSHCRQRRSHHQERKTGHRWQRHHHAFGSQKHSSPRHHHNHSARHRSIPGTLLGRQLRLHLARLPQLCGAQYSRHPSNVVDLRATHPRWRGSHLHRVAGRLHKLDAHRSPIQAPTPGRGSRLRPHRRRFPMVQIHRRVGATSRLLLRLFRPPHCNARCKARHLLCLKRHARPLHRHNAFRRPWHDHCHPRRRYGNFTQLRRRGRSAHLRTPPAPLWRRRRSPQHRHHPC